MDLLEVICLIWFHWDDLHLEHGVFTDKPLFKDDFIVEYSGNLVTAEEGEELEEAYKRADEEQEGSSVGSFLYFFREHW